MTNTMAIACGFCMLTLLSSIASLVLGLKCGARQKRKKVSSHDKGEIKQIPEAVIYEEISEFKKSGSYILSPNNAYGDIRKS